MFTVIAAVTAFLILVALGIYLSHKLRDSNASPETEAAAAEVEELKRQAAEQGKQ